MQNYRCEETVPLPEKVEETPYGKKYKIEGPLVGPNGKKTRVVSIWIVRKGEDFPRFVTAYPA